MQSVSSRRVEPSGLCRDTKTIGSCPRPSPLFNTQTAYKGNPNGDWVRYFADVLFQITSQGGKVDALALHAHTHGYDANFITSDAKAGKPFANRHWHFRVYRDFLAAVLPMMRKLPVFITAAFPLDPGWTNANRGWIQAACRGNQHVEQQSGEPTDSGRLLLSLASPAQRPAGLGTGGQTTSSKRLPRRPPK